MYYKFGSNSGDDIANEIDTAVVLKVLNKRYHINDIEDYDERVVVIKKVIKDIKEFKQLSKASKTDYEELITCLVRIFPFKLFNHHLIKFIKANYLNE